MLYAFFYYISSCNFAVDLVIAILFIDVLQTSKFHIKYNYDNILYLI